MSRSSPAWFSAGVALGSSGENATFRALSGIDALMILAETGDASQRAVDECGQRWHDAGREVIVATSTMQWKRCGMKAEKVCGKLNDAQKALLFPILARLIRRGEMGGATQDRAKRRIRPREAKAHCTFIERRRWTLAAGGRWRGRNRP